MNDKKLVNKRDSSSYSNSHEAIITHLNWKVDVDFESKVLSCIADFNFNALSNTLNEVILDTVDLDIQSIKINKDEIKSFHIDLNQEFKSAFGNPLVINVEKFKFTSNTSFNLEIEYKTNPNAPAINFLKKEQTLSKSYPCMFAQCEPIHARSILPCQDTPSVKFTVDCEVITPCGISGLFSGVSVKENIAFNGKISNTFIQKVPIPSYLCALACGDFKKRKISERVNVYAEKELLDKACKEFENTETFINIAEEYTGIPYMFNTFDLLVLPPSFPYGGMENPNLTFINPAVVVGDKSAVSTIAHELAHSWTGNLVTNENWTNFFVNEGFTVFLERKIIKAYYGGEKETIQTMVGLNNLLQDITTIGETHSFTSLQPNLQGVNPDDAFSKVPYEKGFWFLRTMEQHIGEMDFKQIFQLYLKEYSGKSTNFNDGFKRILCNYLKEKLNTSIDDKINWDSWLNEPGKNFIPIQNISESFNNLSAYIDLLFKGNKDSIFSICKIYNSQNCAELKILLLQRLSLKANELPQDTFDLLNDYFAEIDIDNYNYDILFEWFMLNLSRKEKKNLPKIKEYLTKTGRGKYVKPLMEKMFEVDKEETISFYSKVKFFYHPILVGILDRKLKLN